MAGNSELVRSGKQILDGHPNAWVTFREWNGQSLAYFSHLVSYRYAIAKIHYSINSEVLNEVFPLTPVDPTNPHKVSADSTTYLPMPYGSKFIAVQLKYRDGSHSKVMHFQNQFPQLGARTAPSRNRSNPSNVQRGGGGRRLLDNVDVNISPGSRPRVRFGIGF